MKPTPVLVTTDVVLFGTDSSNADEAVLLIQRKNPPYQNAWALPGGFVDPGEDLPEAAARELYEETNVDATNLLQVGAFGNPKRDSRGRVITIAYTTKIARTNVQPKAADDAKNVRWFSITELPDLAFDHAEIIEAALRVQD